MEVLQKQRTFVSAFSNSDWASKSLSGQRKSTSSGVAYVDGVLVLSFSPTQKAIATSSCEAELYAVSGTAIESRFVKELTQFVLEVAKESEFRVDLELRVQRPTPF